MKTISQIIAGAQALLAISYDPGHRRPDANPHAALCRNRRDTVSVYPVYTKFFAKSCFGIERTSHLIQRVKGEPNLRLLCGFTDVPGKATGPGRVVGILGVCYFWGRQDGCGGSGEGVCVG
jgi:hypothetical protein